MADRSSTDHFLPPLPTPAPHETTSDPVANLHALADGYRDAQILFTAFQAGIFEALQQATTAEDLTRNLGWSQRGTVRMLGALTALDLVEKRGQHYRNAPAATACLTEGGEAWLGGFITHTLRTQEEWGQLPECVRTGRGAKEGKHPPGSQAQAAFALGMDDLARMNAPTLVERLDFLPGPRLLDLGGGLGGYSQAFLEVFPHLHSTLFDLPGIVDTAEQRFQESPFASRIAFHAGDCLHDPIGTGYDTVFASNLLHSLSPADVQRLLRRCFKALLPGGVLILKDFFTDAGRTGPPFSLLFAVQMLLHSEAGGAYTLPEIATWTREAGYEGGRMLSPSRKAILWITQKPTQGA